MHQGIIKQSLHSQVWLMINTPKLNKAHVSWIIFVTLDLGPQETLTPFAPNAMNIETNDVLIKSTF
jgi:hypothetical protein